MATPSETMRAWRLHEYGEPLDVLRLETVPTPTPGPGELLVHVVGIPVNLNDLERISGGNMMVRPEFPYAPGMEVMGTVEAAGPGAESRIGTRVVATTKGAHGGYAEYAVCPSVSAFTIPASIPMPDAASLYFPYHLAWLGLFDRAALTAGETVLIHAAAGGSGTAAVQLAVEAGARVIATVGTEAKAQFCRDLGAELAIVYGNDDWPAAVLEATDNHGVDVVFDNVGEAVLEGSLKCTKYNGRYVMMGFASNKLVADEPFLVPRRLMLSNMKLCGVLLSYGDAATNDFIKSAMGWNFVPVEIGEGINAAILERYERGALAPVIGAVSSFDELPAAVDAFARRQIIGRSIITVEGSR